MPELELPEDRELGELLLAACAARLGILPSPPQDAVLGGRRDAMKKLLTGLKDDDGKPLSVHSVYAVFDEDARGLVEALFLRGNVPMTAWLRGRELAYLVEGW